jgi:hypothetical protein
MSTPKSSDDVMRDLNELARAQGRHLGQAFWEIPRQPGSIVDVPLTPEAEERIRRLDARIARLKRERVPARDPEGQEEGRAEVSGPATASPPLAPTDVPPAGQRSGR